MDEEEIEREYEEKLKIADKNFIKDLNNGIKSKDAEKRYRAELDEAWEDYEKNCKDIFEKEKKKKRNVPQERKEDKDKKQKEKKEEEILKNFKVKERNRDLNFRDKQKFRFSRIGFKISRLIRNFFYWWVHPKIINLYFRGKKAIKRAFIFQLRMSKRFLSSLKKFFLGIIGSFKKKFQKVYSKISLKIKKIKEKKESKKKKKKDEGEEKGEKSDIEKVEEKMLSDQ